MARYAAERCGFAGVPIIEDESRSTWNNVRNVIPYLEDVERRPEGHPDGGKMYIDGSFSLYRELNPDFIALFANPVLSVQRGSTSSLASTDWRERLSPRQRIVELGRACRDEMWRRTGIYVWNAPTG